MSQTGGNLEGAGRLDFELQPYVDRESAKMGVRERHFSTRLRQTGNFIPQQNVTHELKQGCPTCLIKTACISRLDQIV